MSAIQNFLEKIKTAIYGEEVRGSIHDAIEQCYKDATGNPESVAAVVEQNDRMADLLENTPYTTAIEETDTFNLPIHTIRDDVTTETSTWSSAKIQNMLDDEHETVNTEIKNKFIVVNGLHNGIKQDSYIEKTINIGTTADLGSVANLQVIFAGQDQQQRWESASGSIEETFTGIYKPMVRSRIDGMNEDEVDSTAYPDIRSVSENQGNITVSFVLRPVNYTTDLDSYYDIKYRIVLMKLS